MMRGIIINIMMAGLLYWIFDLITRKCYSESDYFWLLIESLTVGVLIILILYFLIKKTFSKVDKSEKKVIEPFSLEKQQEIERKRKEGYQKYLAKKRAEKIQASKTNNKSIKRVIKSNPSIENSQMSLSEFEDEINYRLNKLRRAKTKIFWVGDEHRTHTWSLEPGGCTVVVLFKNETTFLGYDKVKRPDRYTKKITEDYISNKLSNRHIDTLEEYISEIYMTSDDSMDLHKAWCSNMKESPWEILEKYRVK
jgi:hypothetical protein